MIRIYRHGGAGSIPNEPAWHATLETATDALYLRFL
jgi:hypothetical protein